MNINNIIENLASESTLTSKLKTNHHFVLFLLIIRKEKNI